MKRGNPGAVFPTDEPIDSQSMIGRAADVSEVYERLHIGTNVVMAAPRRTGKTTVCRAALERMESAGAYVVRVDLFEITDASALATKLIEETIKNRPAVYRAFHAANKLGHAIYDGLSVTAGAKLFGAGDLEGFDISALPKLSRDPAAQIDFAFHLLQDIASADSRPLVLSIDEFQDINRIGETLTPSDSASLKRKLRAALQQSPNVSSLFSGSYEHTMLALFSDSREPFYQWGSFAHLTEITHAQWSAGLRSKFSLDGTSITDDALSVLVDLGGGHPRATMLLAQQSHLFSILGALRTITIPSVRQGYEMAMRAERDKHQAWTDRIRNLASKPASRYGFRVIQTIAQGGHPYSLSTLNSDIQRATRSLRDAGLIAEAGQRRWMVTDPLFAEYLKRLG